MSSASLASSHGSANYVRFKAEQQIRASAQSPHTVTPPRTVPSPQPSRSGSMDPSLQKAHWFTSKPTLHDVSLSRPDTPVSSESGRSPTFVEGRLLLNDLEPTKTSHVRFVHLESDRADLDLDVPLELFGQQLGEGRPRDDVPPPAPVKRIPKHPPRKLRQKQKPMNAKTLSWLPLEVCGNPIVSAAVLELWKETPGREGVDESVLQTGSVMTVVTDESAENEKGENVSGEALEEALDDKHRMLNTTLNTTGDLTDMLPNWPLTSPSFADSENLGLELPVNSGSEVHISPVRGTKQDRGPQQADGNKPRHSSRSPVSKQKWSSMPVEIRGYLRRVPSCTPASSKSRAAPIPIVPDHGQEATNKTATTEKATTETATTEMPTNEKETVEKASVEVQCSDALDDYDPDDDSMWSTGRRRWEMKGFEAFSTLLCLRL